MSPSPSHVMYPFARFPFVRFLEDIVQVIADDTNSHMRVHTYEFVCDQSTNTNSYVIDQYTISYLRLGTPPIYHIR
jgi:hypothetical protein